MLKITGLSKALALKASKADDNEIVEIDGRADKMFKNLSKCKKSKNKKFKIQTCIRATKKPTFLTPSAKETFNFLKQAFIETLIF